MYKLKKIKEKNKKRIRNVGKSNETKNVDQSWEIEEKRKTYNDKKHNKKISKENVSLSRLARIRNIKKKVLNLINFWNIM